MNDAVMMSAVGRFIIVLMIGCAILLYLIYSMYELYRMRCEIRDLERRLAKAKGSIPAHIKALQGTEIDTVKVKKVTRSEVKMGFE